MNNHLKAKLVSKVQIILLKRVAGSEQLQMVMIFNIVHNDNDNHDDDDDLSLLMTMMIMTSTMMIMMMKTWRTSDSGSFRPGQ